MGDMETILGTFKITGESESTYDVTVMVQGGGVTGQVDAVKLGLSRAMIKLNPDFRLALRQNGYLTRDPRVKERKKPGLKRAR
jgi:small subunit ribosomal protein S9